MAEHTFKIDIDEDRIVAAVADRIVAMHSPEYDDETGEPLPSTSGRKTIEDRVRQVVLKTVREAVESTVATVTEAAVKDAVAACLAEGWQKTNNYGEPSGPKMDLKARIGELLVKLQDNGYNSNRQNLVEALIRSAVEGALKTEFAPAIAEAKVKFKALLDGSISATLAETLKGALGLR